MIVYTHIHTLACTCALFLKIEGKKSSKRVLRGKEKYTKKEKEGEGRKKGRGERKRRLPWWPIGKESACNTGDSSSIPGLGGSHMPCSN